MSAIYYIINALLELALFVVLSRLLLQWTRADFRNPISQAVVHLTNPLILPLRRILPPIRKVDTASVVAVVLVTLIVVAVRHAFTGGLPTEAGQWGLEMAMTIIDMLLRSYLYMIILYALLSLIAPGGYSPMQSVLASVCEPVLRPFRRLIPPLGGLDLSPVWACILLQALHILLFGI